LDNIKPNVLWDGVKLTYENSMVLLQGAADASHRNNYGLASSLTVLSAEESSKALGILSQLLGIDKDVKLKQYFKNHKHKHKAGLVFLGTMMFSNLLMSEVSAIEDNIGIPDDRKVSHFLERVNYVCKAEINGERDNFAKVALWSENADSLKQQGFYVDYANNKWSPPSEISIETYEVQLEYAEALLKLLKSIIRFDTYENLLDYFEKFKS